MRFIIFLITLTNAALCQPANTAERPNIVLLLADDLGWTGLDCFGSDFYETPHLDKLAENGVKFTNAYSACTVCSPTRASIMTGIRCASVSVRPWFAWNTRASRALANACS